MLFVMPLLSWLALIQPCAILYRMSYFMGKRAYCGRYPDLDVAFAAAAFYAVAVYLPAFNML